MTLLLSIPGQTPIPLGEEGRCWTLGRSSQNDVPIPEASLSRHHARITVREGVPWLEDLGSRNGTRLNGEAVTAPRPLKEQDEIHLGQVALTVGSPSRILQVRVDLEGDPSTQGSRVVPLVPLEAPGESAETRRLRKVIQEIQALSLELLVDSPPEQLFGQLLDTLWNLLNPWRAAVLLLDGHGGLRTAASRGSDGEGPIQLTRGLVEAAVGRRESLLYSDQGEFTAPSASMVVSGIRSAIVTPMQHQGVVQGLLYLDCRPPHPPFDEHALRLANTLAHLATAKLEQARVREEALARRKVDHELGLARQIQQGLLPGAPPEIPGYEVLGNNFPSRQVSGDLYGWWPRGDGRWLFCLADVSGKGLGPGLLMASLQATLEAWADLDLSVSELATRLSRNLHRHTDGRRFVTAFLALLDPAAGTLAYTNAGHNPALYLGAGGAVTPLGAQGLPLAILPGNTYQEGRLDLAPGDLVALYTDGLTEAADPSGDEFGLDALTAVLVQGRTDSLLALDAQVFGALERFAQGEPFLDDRTLLLLRRQ